LSVRVRTHRPDAQQGKGKAQGALRGQSRQASAGQVAWAATLAQGRPQVRDDLRWQRRQARPAELWVVIVDSSASTRRQGALAQAKGLLAECFDQAYRQRARLALLTASGSTPRWQCHGLKASQALQDWLQHLGAGGGTPLLAALTQARHWLLARQKRLPDERQRCLVLTDGRLPQWAPLQPLPCASLVVDMELSPVRVGRAHLLAEQLEAEYQALHTFKPR
jgi:magnesium chelatase subunit ChlD-like protein